MPSTLSRRITPLRWCVALIGGALTALLVAGTSFVVPPTYTEQADVLVLPPKTVSGNNPLLGLNGLEEVADVLARALSDASVSQAMSTAGVPGKYTAERDQTTSGPVVLVTTTGATPSEAASAMSWVTDQVPSTLENLQNPLNVPANARLTSTTLTKSAAPKAVRKSMIRAMIAVGVIGIALCLLVIALGERLLRRRAARLTRRRDDDSSDSAAGVVDPQSAGAGTAEQGAKQTAVVASSDADGSLVTDGGPGRDHSPRSSRASVR